MASPTRWAAAGTLACLAVALGGLSCAAAAISTGRLEEMTLSTLGLEIFIGLAAVALVLPGRVAPAERLGLGPGRLSTAQLAALALGTVALSHGIDEILRWSALREDSALQELDRELAASGGRPLLIALLALVVAAPLAEELLCRGLVQRGLETSLGAAAGIGLASAFFAALHMEPVHAAAVLPLGLYLGMAAWLAGSIRASIACHLANNAAAVAAVRFPTPLPEGALAVAGSFAVAGLVLALVWWRAGTPPPLRWREQPLQPT